MNLYDTKIDIGLRQFGQEADVIKGYTDGETAAISASKDEGILVWQFRDKSRTEAFFVPKENIAYVFLKSLKEEG